MKYTMVDGNKDGTYTLYCYMNGSMVAEKLCASLEVAQEFGSLFLEGHLIT